MGKIRVYVGIDPGLHGAVAAVDRFSAFRGVWDAPTTIVKRGKKSRTVYEAPLMVHILRSLQEKYEVQLVGMERVNAMPGQGVTSMFSMGHGFGLWEGIISALGLPLELTVPQVWKKKMLAGGKGDDKQASIVRAMQLFPAAAPLLARKKDDGRAEALLIAEFFRRRMKKERS